MRRIGILVALLCAQPACAHEEPEPGPPGYAHASSDPPPGTHRPLVPGDLEGVLQRGNRLHALERIRRLAGRSAAVAAATAQGGPMVPLVRLDPGGTSGQVTYYRLLEGSRRRPVQARRVLRLSVMLAPPRVLTVRSLDERVQPQTSVHHRLAATLAARRAVSAQRPDETFHTHVLLEHVKPGTVRAHAYLFGTTPQAPDYEVVLGQLRKRKLPEVREVVRVHADGAGAKAPIRTTGARLSPMTIARGLALKPETSSFGVRTPRGALRVLVEQGHATRVAQ